MSLNRTLKSVVGKASAQRLQGACNVGLWVWLRRWTNAVNQALYNMYYGISFIQMHLEYIVSWSIIRISAIHYQSQLCTHWYNLCIIIHSSDFQLRIKK